ncbi:MAG TPA: branched-chain amino acid ABC transporter permease [Usitatibacter sp.]|nr:branched-chain amino acid ABC transporter permease [Usitatibacter sp.]
MSPAARRRWIVWGGFAAVLVAAPLVFNKGFSLSLLCQMGILIIFALSYNMLLGQTGLLSFGHAVYYGLGAIISIHALNLVQAGWKFPVTLMPLVGGAAGLFFGVIFGYVTTRRAGTTFSMISLGVGEMVAACSLMFPAFFGGEAGVSGNRSAGGAFLGLTYGPQIQIYYLVAAWLLLATAAMYALSRTPLGRMANAVRDNPERAQFVGYDPQHVRFMMVALSGFFAGVAGGLSALNYEIVTAESVSAATSGMVLLATYLGGIGFFAGPIAGAIVVTLMQTALGSVTKAWPFYFGAMFLATVLFVPGGLASVAMLHKRLWDARLVKKAAGVYAIMAVPSVVVLGFAVLLVEMAYNASDESRSAFNALGITLDTTANGTWIAVIALTIAAIAGWRLAWRVASPRWSELGAALAGDRRR